jgi:hypothetical protein
MTKKFNAVLLAAVLVAASPSAAVAAQTPVMTFEEFVNGATNVDDFYLPGVLTWGNEEVFDALGTPAQPPFAGSKVLTRGTCGVVACELELVSTLAIETISLSGLISSGPDLLILAFNGAGQQVGGALTVDTYLQSVGCAIATDWTCNRSFDFTQFEDVRRLQFMTSGTAVIDNVQVTTFQGIGGSVPEPATLVLVGIGLLGMVVSRSPEDLKLKECRYCRAVGRRGATCPRHPRDSRRQGR